jgi:hypothetical protein
MQKFRKSCTNNFDHLPKHCIKLYTLNNWIATKINHMAKKDEGKNNGMECFRQVLTKTLESLKQCKDEVE